MLRPSLYLLAFVSVAQADLFLSGFNTNAVYRYDEVTGAPIGSGVFIAPNSGGLSLPHGILRLADGTFIVASAANDRILRYSATGAFMNAFVENGVNGVPADTLDYPVDFALGVDGLLYVTSQLNDRVVRFNATTGAFAGVFLFGGALDGPSGLAFHPNGDLYVAGRNSDNVVRYNGTTGAQMADLTGPTLGQPFGIAVHPTNGDLYVAEGDTNSVLRLDPTSGAISGTINTGGLAFPIGVEFGPGGDLYAASFNNDKLARFDGITSASEGDFVMAGSAGVDGPNFFAFAVPEPSSAAIAGVGVALLGLRRSRRA